MLERQTVPSTLRRLLFAVCFVYGVFGALPAPAEAKTPVEPVRWHLDGATLLKGFTMATAADEIRLGVTAESLEVTDEAWVRLKQIKKSKVKIKKQRLLSRLYSYDIFNEKTIGVKKPLWLSVQWDTNTDEDYTMKYWDGAKSKWRKLDTTVNTDIQRAYTTVEMPYAIVGVFEKKRAEEEGLRGIASWYDWYGAAMNDFPIGTEVLVTNPATGAQAQTKIVSTGPFIPGRIIDLPREVFDALGSLSAGVMEVVVTQVK
jgi:rare lipoprotein A (peptidoglycan hydrolase)